jgi:hypothetical protein
MEGEGTQRVPKGPAQRTTPTWMSSLMLLISFFGFIISPASPDLQWSQVLSPKALLSRQSLHRPSFQSQAQHLSCPHQWDSVTCSLCYFLTLHSHTHLGSTSPQDTPIFPSWPCQNWKGFSALLHDPTASGTDSKPSNLSHLERMAPPMGEFIPLF